MDKLTRDIAKVYVEAVERTLTGQDLILALTNTCLKAWYDITNVFVVDSSKYDADANSQEKEQYMMFKMSPGDDYREKAITSIQKAAENLSSNLNRLFGREVFVPKLSRDNTSFEVLVAYKEAEGGVFQCKAKETGGYTSFVLLMPDETNLDKTFSAMTRFPHPNDGFDDPSGDPVANDPTGEFDPEYDTFDSSDYADDLDGYDDEEFDNDPLDDYNAEDRVESLISKWNQKQLQT